MAAKETVLLFDRIDVRYSAIEKECEFVGDERLLSPEELAALFRRLDALLEEARTLQQQITERLLTTKRQDQSVRTGQPERRKTTRKK